MKKIYLLPFALLISLPVFAQRKALKEKEVSRIVKTLSADQMQGRQVFTAGIQKASGFIEKEFKKAGLQPLPGLTGFRQEFPLYKVTPKLLQVRLGGQVLGEEAVFASSGAKSLHWSASDAARPRVTRVGAGENLIQAARQALGQQQNQLVLVDPAHAALFKRLKNSISHAGFRTELSSSAAVFILTDQAAADAYEVKLEQSVEQQVQNNVVGYLPGKSRKEELVLFSAHYDHIGIQAPVEGDSIANGADDDASGTTAVIALAKYFKKKGGNARSLVFVAFTAEEVGGYGSQYFSKQLNPDQVVAMFNIEMIGKESPFGRNAGFITGFERSDMGKIIQKNLAGSSYKFHPDPFLKENLFYRSDNATLARLGVPAHSLSTDKIDTDPYYHTVNDEVETLDLAHMTQTIQAIAQGATSIIAGEDTPSRITKEQ
ncbi:MAG: M20/M25/M40 family metallo-hydrolase [Adhaeribacter sp.]